MKLDPRTWFQNGNGNGKAVATTHAIPRWMKQIAFRSGVTFVGPDIRNSSLIRLDNDVAPEARELTRASAYATSVYCYTAIMYRARRIAEPPLMVVQENDEGVDEWVADHELGEVLDEPSPDYDMGELQQLTEIYRLVTGSCVWLKQDNLLGLAARFTPFSGNEIRTFSAAGRIFGKFEININNSWRPYKPEDVVYFRDIHPWTWRRGLSTLDIVLAQLNLGHAVNRIVKRFMNKAMFPGGVISPHPDWDPDDDAFKEYTDRIDAWHSGPENAGTPLVLLGGSTFSRSAFPLKDLLPAEILDRIEANVASGFGIPPVVLGWLVGLENSPWSNIVEARRMGYEDTIEPRWRDVEKRLTRQLLSVDERAAGMKIVFDTRTVRALQEDEERRARIAASAPDWTEDERRAYMGKDPLPEEEAVDVTTDEPLNGAQVTAALDVLTRCGEGSISEDAAVELLVSIGLPRDRAEIMVKGQPDVAPTLVDPAGEEDEEETEDDEDDPEETPPPPPPVAEDEDEEDDEDEDEAGGSAPAERKGRRLQWALFEANTKAAEAGWTRAVLSALREQRSAVLRLARKHLVEAKAATSGSADEFQLALFDWIKKSGTPRMQKTVYPLLVSTGGRGVRAVAAKVGVSFNVLQPGLLTYAKEEASFLAHVMGETTGHAVADAVQKGLREGETIRELVKRLETLPAFDRTRAKMTARTETTRAWNGAGRRSLSEYSRESGRVAMKTWLSAQDDRVRPEHEEQDGQQVPIDEPFENGLMEPSEPNCRCTLTYSLADATDE